MKFAHATPPQRPARDNLVSPSSHHFRQRGSLSREIQSAQYHVPRRSAAQSALRSVRGLLGERVVECGGRFALVEPGARGSLVVRGVVVGDKSGGREKSGEMMWEVE